MKKNYAFVIAAIMSFVSFSGNAQSVSLPEAQLSVAPMGSLENNGSAMASFSFSESSGVDVPSSINNGVNVKIAVSLKYLELTNADVSQVTGNLLDYFEVSYNEVNDVLRFVQTNDIPGDWYGKVTFPVSVTQNSTREESYNGFYANILALDSKTNGQGNTSIFTSTDASVLEVVDIEALTLPFEVIPNPTDGEFTIFLQNTNDTKVALFDLLGKEIFTKEYTALDRISLNIDHLASAVYVLKVTSGGVTNNVQIIRK